MGIDNFARPRARVSCISLQTKRSADVQIQMELLQKVANTADKPPLGPIGTALLTKYRRIEPLKVCSVATTAWEDVVSSNNGAHRMVDR